MKARRTTGITATLAGLSVVLLSWQGALAGGNPGGFELPEFLKPFDVDGDGELSEAEWQVAESHRDERRENRQDEWDTDDDGALSVDEIEAAQKEILDDFAKEMEEHFDWADTNNDGFLSLEEFSADPANDIHFGHFDVIFAAIDANSDNLISKEEFLAFFHPIWTTPIELLPKDPLDLEWEMYLSLARVFRSVDTDDNGSLNESEIVVYYAGGFPEFEDEARELFNRADTNQDGEVTLSEFTEAHHVVDPFVSIDDNEDGQLTHEEMVASGMAPDLATRIITDFDRDEDGKISRAEFDDPPPSDFEKIAEAEFNMMDLNSDGVLTLQELLDGGMPADLAHSLIHIFDLNEDGVISKEEYVGDGGMFFPDDQAGF